MLFTNTQLQHFYFGNENKHILKNIVYLPRRSSEAHSGWRVGDDILKRR